MNNEIIRKLNNQYAAPVCGVDSTVCYPYKFEDHRWTMPMIDPILAGKAAMFKDLLYLASNVVVACNDNYLVKVPGASVWAVKKKAVAIKDLRNTLIGKTLPNGSVFDEEMLSIAFEGKFSITIPDESKKSRTIDIECASLPVIDQTFAVPLGPQTLKMFNEKGLRTLNTWVDSRVLGDEACIKEGGAVLRLLYRGLCSGAELSPDAATETEILLQQIADNAIQNDNFRFALNWLAALVQRPGINLLTNLWFLGTRQGNGKGTLVGIMKTILGEQVTTKLSEKDVMERGWNNILLGKQLVEVDEIQESKYVTRDDWNRWIKATTCEPTLTITERGCTPVITANTANYIFTSNNETPIAVEVADRRNQFIRTNSDVEWVEFASAIKNECRHSTSNAKRYAAGFAWILERVQLDLRLVSRAFVNDLKREIISVGATSIDHWISNDIDVVRGEWVKGGDLYESYKFWCMHNNKGDFVTNVIFGKTLSKLRYVERQVRGRNISYYKINLEMTSVEEFNFARGEDALRTILKTEIQSMIDLDEIETEDLTRFVLDEKKKKMQAMRLALKQQEIEQRNEPC